MKLTFMKVCSYEREALVKIVKEVSMELNYSKKDDSMQKNVPLDISKLFYKF